MTYYCISLSYYHWTKYVVEGKCTANQQV